MTKIPLYVSELAGHQMADSRNGLSVNDDEAEKLQSNWKFLELTFELTPTANLFGEGSSSPLKSRHVYAVFK
ncbi:hypothetical protein HAX54_042631 [Datura stramonium]|uniref:Uncharacterized protein n=1 Tax=Datura stramonium TaxID=4076 RepID=A0ABS8RSB2_DATST|nr:hypothetical protein [Datura stramonium]